MFVTILALQMNWNKYKKVYMFNQCFNLPLGIRPLAIKRKPLLLKVFFFQISHVLMNAVIFRNSVTVDTQFTP